MPDPSWNTYRPPPLRRFPGWARVLVGLAGALLLLLGALFTQVEAARRQAWPLARLVAARLATEAGTRDLYDKNPDLSELYPTEQAFLDAIGPLRAGLRLPEQEPPRGHPGYGAGGGPFATRLRVRGEGETWMELVVLRPSTFGPQPRGEGISRLVLAESPKGLLVQFRRLREAGFQRHWLRFRETAAALGAGDRGLQDRPGLARRPADPGAFLGLCETRRAGLAALPATQAEAAVRLSIHRGRQGRDTRMSCPLPGGGSLSLSWKNDQLVAVQLD